KIVQNNLVKTCGNFAAGNKNHTQLLLDNDVIPILFNYLNTTQDLTMKFYTCWCFSNLAADHSFVEALLTLPNFMKTIINNINQTTTKISNESIFTVCNVCMHLTFDKWKFYNI